MCGDSICGETRRKMSALLSFEKNKSDLPSNSLGVLNHNVVDRTQPTL